MPCPVCHKPSVEKFTPFCSQRCSDVDLGRWIIGSYAVPAVEGNAAKDEEHAEE